MNNHVNLTVFIRTTLHFSHVRIPKGKPMSVSRMRTPPGKGRALGMFTVSLTTLVTVGLFAVPFIDAAGASSSQLQSVNVSGYPGALANQASKTLYILTVEKGAKLKCKGSCLTAWIPVTVKDSVATVSLRGNVKGKIGFVARSSTTKQVTFNSYPLYTFSGDSAARQSHGEGKSFAGGKWYVVKADASTPGATPIVKAASTGGGSPTTTRPPTTTTTHAPTTTTVPTTTTTVGGGGGGY
jgi:predicted lipoprotein with Yx(FWY)xxD motif